MSALPPIPDEAVRAAYDEIRLGSDTEDILAAAWPHLYAAALRHAADEIEREGGAFRAFSAGSAAPRAGSGTSAPPG